MTSAACLVVAIVCSVSASGCASAEVVRRPANFPVLETGWVSLVDQVPSSASGTIFVEFDQDVQEHTDRIFSVIDQFSDLSDLLSDRMGVDLTAPGAFERFGMRPHGGATLFLYDRFWVAVVDLDTSAALQAILTETQQRNPDLDMRWREVDGSETLSVFFDEEPRFHALLADRQVVLVFDVSPTLSLATVDDLLVSVRDASWHENVSFNRRFAEAIDTFGTDAWTLFFVDVEDLFAHLPEMPPVVGALTSVFGPPPSAERCADVRGLIPQAVPWGFGAIIKSVEGEGSDDSFVHEERWVRFHLTPEALEAAELLVPPAILHQAHLERGAVLSAFVNLHPATLVEYFGEYADAASCPGFSAIVGVAGRAAELFETDTDHYLNGLLAAALFDLRLVSGGQGGTGLGVPFADAIVVIGSEQPHELSRLAEAWFEEEQHLRGTAGEISGLRFIHYRFAQLYRLSLYEGLTSIALSLGHIGDQWLENVLGTEAPQNADFLGIAVDGERLEQIYSALVGITGVGSDVPTVVDEAAESDIDRAPESTDSPEEPFALSDTERAQQAVVEASLEELRGVRHVHVSARLIDGFIEVQMTRDSDL